MLIAGHELLHGLPVELLPIDEPEQWLGLRHAIAYEPSITLALRMLRREPRSTEATAVLLAALRNVAVYLLNRIEAPSLAAATRRVAAHPHQVLPELGFACSTTE